MIVNGEDDLEGLHPADADEVRRFMAFLKEIPDDRSTPQAQRQVREAYAKHYPEYSQETDLDERGCVIGAECTPDEWCLAHGGLM